MEQSNDSRSTRSIAYIRSYAEACRRYYEHMGERERGKSAKKKGGKQRKKRENRKRLAQSCSPWRWLDAAGCEPTVLEHFRWEFFRTQNISA